MREFLNEPVTYSTLLALYLGVMLGKISVSYLEHRRWKKLNAEWIDQTMRDAGYRD